MQIACRQRRLRPQLLESKLVNSRQLSAHLDEGNCEVIRRNGKVYIHMDWRGEEPYARTEIDDRAVKN